jgi:hypothetical protein
LIRGRRFKYGENVMSNMPIAYAMTANKPAGAEYLGNKFLRWARLYLIIVPKPCAMQLKYSICCPWILARTTTVPDDQHINE